jgi:hypothetical protein
MNTAVQSVGCLICVPRKAGAVVKGLPALRRRVLGSFILFNLTRLLKVMLSYCSFSAQPKISVHLWPTCIFRVLSCPFVAQKNPAAMRGLIKILWSINTCGYPESRDRYFDSLS